MTNLLWQRLEGQLREKISTFPGIAGIALKDLGEGFTVGINADEIFPTASTIKIHVLTKLLQRAEAGEIDLSRRITVDPTTHVLGSGVIAYLEGPITLTLRDMATLMMIASDNTATNICIDYAGIADTNALIQEMGLVKTVLRRKMMDNIATMQEQENVSTPAELIAMLALLHEGKPSPTVAAQTLEIMKKQNYGFIDRGIPATVAVANKPGWIEAVMCDAALVYLPRRPYLLAVMTKYALCSAATQERFIIDISEIVYETMQMLDTSSTYGRVVHL